MRIIAPQTEAALKDYFDLRYRILRKPWGKPNEKEESDVTAFHFLALNDQEEGIGVCRLHLNSEKEAQIRFMGVLPQEKGKGIGSALLKEAEQKAREEGASNIILHARANATDFYKSKGYRILNKSHLLWGTIQHYLMEKDL